jgi:hypothetical protein
MEWCKSLKKYVERNKKKNHPEEVKSEDFEIFNECYQLWRGIDDEYKNIPSLYVKVGCKLKNVIR